MTVRPFPYGFIYSSSENVSPAIAKLGWKQIETPSEGRLWVSPDQPVYSYSSTSYTAIWIGYAKFLSSEETAREDVAQRSVTILENDGWKAFHEAMDLVVGRFVAFIWENGKLRVYHDPVAMRPVYFNLNDGLVASHAPLIRELREVSGKDIKPLIKLGQHKLWDETEDPDVRALPVNFYLDVSQDTIRRFYPHSPINPESLTNAERVAKATQLARQSMDFWSSLSLPLHCALTGGLDTRMNAAAALGSGLDINYVTYGSLGDITESDTGSGRSYKVDFHVTRKISKALNLKHTLLPVQDTPKYKLSEDDRKTLERNTFGSHAIQFQGLYENAIGAHPGVYFVGTAFEGMRDYFVSSRRPLSTLDEFKATISAVGGFKKDIRESELTDDVATELWNRYEMQSAVDNDYPIANLIFTEVRAGRFQNEAINCQATAFLPVNPLAVRRLFEHGQAFSYTQRKNGDFLHSFIEAIFPAISAFGINEKPKHTPMASTPKEIAIKEARINGSEPAITSSPQNRNDRIMLDSNLLASGSSKFFEKRFSLPTGALDISLVNNYFLGRPARNISLFVSVNQVEVASTPIGLRRSPYHFHIEGLKEGDTVQAGIRTNSDLGPAWISYTTVDLIKWAEFPDSSSSKLAVGSTIEMNEVPN
ncbi:hypothetical protein CZ765_12615 [Corynebacterium casei]|uniref:hypothetical protein n=1 Tax=Corynebacterium casei TaxID=160386 RepID=UPI0009CCF9FF|nr:hypothetical protein [Corynebacterium casei]SLM94214.1 hypothetical protein CZ765_12615 [Corynebacterium casei]